jgi:hypothetical protein
MLRLCVYSQNFGREVSRMNENQKRPNVMVILNDDMGYSDIGCYGGEVHTPIWIGWRPAGFASSSFTTREGAHLPVHHC